MTKIIPAEHDARQYGIICQVSDAGSKLDSVRNLMHRLTGDKKRWIGKIQVWNMSWAEVRTALRILIEDGDKRDLSYGVRPSQLLAQETELLAEIGRLNVIDDAMEATWRAHRWNRYFPCLNADGHIHTTLRGCSSVSNSTAMGWDTELSGMTVEQAIAKLGPRLCSICFPGAPAEHCLSLREITREQRDAEKAERLAARELAVSAKRDRQAAREAKAELPRKETPQERRWAALKYLTGFYPDEAALLAAGREKVAVGIMGLAPFGQSSKWKDAITAWAGAVRDEENSLLWAFTQYSVWAAHAA